MPSVSALLLEWTRTSWTKVGELSKFCRKNCWKNICETEMSGQFGTTFPAGWSPQMVVEEGNPTQNGLKLGYGFVINCPEM